MHISFSPSSSQKNQKSKKSQVKNLYFVLAPKLKKAKTLYDLGLFTNILMKTLYDFKTVYITLK